MNLRCFLGNYIYWKFHKIGMTWAFVEGEKAFAGGRCLKCGALIKRKSLGHLKWREERKGQWSGPACEIIACYEFYDSQTGEPVKHPFPEDREDFLNPPSMAEILKRIENQTPQIVELFRDLNLTDKNG